MPELNDLTEDSPAKLSRRNVVVGTAWAVPAIALVGSAPAMAATSLVKVEASLVRKNLTIKITVSGWTSGDQATISISPSITWKSGSNPTGVKTLTGAVTEILGETQANGNGKTNETVTVTVTGVAGSKTANFAY